MLLKIYSSEQNNWLAKNSRFKRKILLGLAPIVAITSWLGYKQIQSYFTNPEAVLVLGGAEERELFAAKFAHQHPDLPIWVSGGSSQWYVEKVFKKAGINRKRLHLDYRAVDTVTNFTTLVDEFKAQGIDSVYLITSEEHMGRARVIGEIVLGSRGIVIKPVAIPSERKPESITKSLRDGVRAIIWVTTGYSGADVAKSANQTKTK